MATSTKNDTSAPKSLTIAPLNIRSILIPIVGIAPLMLNRFSIKAKTMMMDRMKAGSTAKGKKVRDARDFDADVKGALYTSPDGWHGMAASAFRAAAISACRLVGFKMTLAKLSIFIEADGYDAQDGTPLVRIAGTYETNVMHVRNQTGVADIRARPLWREWKALVRVKYDADQFTAQDVINLFARVGQQVGIGEGRPDSRESAGLGYGMFRVDTDRPVSEVTRK